MLYKQQYNAYERIWQQADLATLYSLAQAAGGAQ